MKNTTANLNKEQKEAVTFDKGPLLIVAGAGTGKTTVITRRILELIKSKKAKPEEILALTFTDKAAEEMEERVDRLLPYGYTDLWISTFHSFCERILKTHGLDIGLATDFKLLNPTNEWLLFRQNFDKFNLDYYRPLSNPSKFIRVLIEHFSKCKDEGIYPEKYLEYSDDLRLNLDKISTTSKFIKKEDKKDLILKQEETNRIKEVAEAYFTFQKLLLENNALNFGDLISYCLKLFEKRPIILEKYRKQFKYILIDEFQDTNWCQYELIKLLARPKNNLTICADDDQAIYRFRGASFNNVLQFRKNYPKTKEIILTNNYRSTQNILDLAYKFIQLNNPNRLEYQMNEVAEISKQAKNKGVNLTNFKKINKKLKAANKENGIVECCHYKTSMQELRGVATKIKTLLNQDKETSLNDFAILARTNSVANLFARAMERENIPYKFLAAQGLYSKPLILDIISYFKLLNNYYENSSVYRILNLPCLKISFEDIAKITQYAHQHGQTVYETLCQTSLIPNISQEGTTKINFILSLIKKHSVEVQKKNLSEIFVKFLKDSGYLDYLVTKENESVIRERTTLINQFYEKIKKFEETEIDPCLANFMEELRMELECGEQGSLKFDPESGPETIKIMTVHSAKGLEFKYVFLVSLVDRRFPTIEKKDPIGIPEKLIKEVAPEGDAHLQEERRLFYVAMTRAKKGLFFTLADDYGGVRKKKQSRFLNECEITKEETKAKGKNTKQAKSIETTQTINSKILAKNPISRKPYNKATNSFIGNNLPGHFSYSQLAAFDKCPLQYKFSHILKIPIGGKAVFSFGKTIHNTLEKFVDLIVKKEAINQGNLFGFTDEKKQGKAKKTLKDFEELKEIYKKEWIDDWYEDKKQKQEYLKLGKKILKIFYNDFVKIKPQIQIINNEPAIEQAFKLKIGGHNLIGKIDRIDDLKDGTCEIIDYKTGKAKEKLTPQDKQQLTIYQIASEDILGLKPSKLTYHYLEGNKKVSFLATEKDKEKLKEKMLKQIEEMKISKFHPKPGWQCQYCDFKGICEYKKNV